MARRPRAARLETRTPAKASYRLPFISAVKSVGLDLAAVTLYGLRHCSIVRALLAGVPTRVVAAQHDTSVPMLERTCPQHILDHSDTVARRGLLDTAQKRRRRPTSCRSPRGADRGAAN